MNSGSGWGRIVDNVIRKKRLTSGTLSESRPHWTMLRKEYVQQKLRELHTWCFFIYAKCSVSRCWKRMASYYMIIVDQSDSKWVDKLVVMGTVSEMIVLWYYDYFVAPWLSGCRYCTTPLNKVWIKILSRFKPPLWHVGGLRW